MSPTWPGPRDVEAYCAPNKYLPPRPESAFLEEVIAQRRGDGLPFDSVTVRRAVENSQRPEYPLPGLYYTPEEEAEIETVDDDLADRVEALLIDVGAEVGSLEWCWLAGRRAVKASVKDDVERHRELLTRELGADRVIVTPARYSGHEQLELSGRIFTDQAELAELGIEVSMWGPSEAGVEAHYFAADREHAQQVLGQRYGPEFTWTWSGPSSLAEEPQPFGSWITEGTRLTVFYPLPHNGERPGSCTAQELPDRVVVSLTVLAPQGSRTEIGGFTPSHATVELAAPVGDRIVIDAAHHLARPEWTGRSKRSES